MTGCAGTKRISKGTLYRSELSDDFPAADDGMAAGAIVTHDHRGVPSGLSPQTIERDASRDNGGRRFGDTIDASEVSSMHSDALGRRPSWAPSNEAHWIPATALGQHSGRVNAPINVAPNKPTGQPTTLRPRQCFSGSEYGQLPFGSNRHAEPTWPL